MLEDYSDTKSLMEAVHDLRQKCGKGGAALIIVRLEDNKGKEAQCNVLEEVLKYIYMISIV